MALLAKTIPSYLYVQYADDDNLQGFVAAYNGQTQNYVQTFNDLNLPNYYSPLVVGPLLDWVGQGLYGLMRPTLPSGKSVSSGPLNTVQLNAISPNATKNTSSGQYYATTDDVYQRVLTWFFYKGDGQVFNIRWLKRRILRFLGPGQVSQLSGGIGSFTIGTTPIGGIPGPVINYDVTATYPVSVQFSGTNTVNINITNGGLNAPILKAGIDSGALQLPFQFSYVVTVT